MPPLTEQQKARISGSPARDIKQDRSGLVPIKTRTGFALINVDEIADVRNTYPASLPNDPGDAVAEVIYRNGERAKHSLDAADLMQQIGILPPQDDRDPPDGFLPLPVAREVLMNEGAAATERIGAVLMSYTDAGGVHRALSIFFYGNSMSGAQRPVVRDWRKSK